MISVSATGGTVINYSDRFTMTGMTGSFSTTVIQGIASISGTDGPPSVNDVTSTTPTTAAAAEGGEYTVAYYLQTGLTKYAPMQPVPGTKITAKNPTPLNPTSAYVLATTALAPPSIVLTVTLSQTFSVSSEENTVCSSWFSKLLQLPEEISSLMLKL